MKEREVWYTQLHETDNIIFFTSTWSMIMILVWGVWILKTSSDSSVGNIYSFVTRNSGVLVFQLIRCVLYIYINMNRRWEGLNNKKKDTPNSSITRSSSPSWLWRLSWRRINSDQRYQKLFISFLNTFITRILWNNQRDESIVRVDPKAYLRIICISKIER